MIEAILEYFDGFFAFIQDNFLLSLFVAVIALMIGMLLAAASMSGRE